MRQKKGILQHPLFYLWVMEHWCCSRLKIPILQKNYALCRLDLFRTLKFLKRKLSRSLHFEDGACDRYVIRINDKIAMIDVRSQVRLRNHASSLCASCRVVSAVSRLKKDKRKITTVNTGKLKANATTSAANDKWNGAKQASQILTLVRAIIVAILSNDDESIRFIDSNYIIVEILKRLLRSCEHF